MLLPFPRRHRPLLFPFRRRHRRRLVPFSDVVSKWLIFVSELQYVAFTYWREAAKEAAKISNALIDSNSSYGIAVRIRRRH